MLSRKQISSNRNSAIRNGEAGYWGNPCSRGHNGWRNLKPSGKGTCAKCDSEQSRLWRENNQDYDKERRKRWYKENKRHAKQYAKAWAEENQDRVKTKNREWSEKNKLRKSALNKRWMEENSDSRKEYSARYREENRYKLTAIENTRRARKAQATPRWAESSNVEWIYRHASLLNCWNGPKAQVDHIVPLNSDIVCGLHWEGNLQILWDRENQSKGNRRWPNMPEDSHASI